MAQTGGGIQEEFMKEFEKKSSQFNPQFYVSPIEYRTDNGGRSGPTFVESLPVGTDILPENISIKLKGRIMTVEVTKTDNLEVPSEHGWMFSIPKTVDISKIGSSLTADGQLRIEGPYL